MEQQTNRRAEGDPSGAPKPACRLAARVMRKIQAAAAKAAARAARLPRLRKGRAQPGGAQLRAARLCRRRWLRPLRRVLIPAAGLALVLGVTAGVLLSNLRHVRIVVEGGGKTVTTFESDPEKILAHSGIRVSAADKVVFSGYSRNNYATISYTAAFAVKVQADGRTVSLALTGGTAADALRQAGVTVGADDLVNVPLDSALTAGEVVTVRRVTYKQAVALTAIPFSTKTVQDTLHVRGTQTVLAAGKAGQRAVTTRIRYIDGKETQRTVVGDTVKTQPVTQVVSVGTASAAPLSKFTLSSLKLDRYGVPLHYSRVYTGSATAYSARRGALTDSGRRAGVGYVAVDPSKIPYGTHLYIMTTDGSVVYGVAVAADTGAFVHDGSGILVDLYFPNRASECRFGERTVNIYVLD